MNELFWEVTSLKKCQNKNVIFFLQRALLEKQYFLLSHHLKYSFSKKQNDKMLSTCRLYLDIMTKELEERITTLENSENKWVLQKQFQKKWYNLFKQQWYQKNDQNIEDNQINIQYLMYSRKSRWWFFWEAWWLSKDERLRYLERIYWNNWNTLKNHEKFKLFFEMTNWDYSRDVVSLNYTVFDKEKSFLYYSLFNWIYWNISNYYVKKYKHLLEWLYWITSEHLKYLSPSWNDSAYTSALMWQLTIIASEINQWKKWSKPWLIKDWMKEYQIKWIKNNIWWIFELLVDYTKTYYQIFKNINKDWIKYNFWKIISVLLFFKELKFLSQVKNLQDFKNKYFLDKNKNDEHSFDELLTRYLQYFNKKEINQVFSKIYDVSIEILREKWLFEIIKENDLNEYLYIIHLLKSKNYWENLLRDIKNPEKILFSTFMYTLLKQTSEYCIHYSNSENSWNKIFEMHKLTQHHFN